MMVFGLALSQFCFLIVDEAQRPIWGVIYFYLPGVACLSCLLGATAGLGRHRYRWLLLVLAAPAFGWVSSLISGSSVPEWTVFVSSIALTVAATTFGLTKWKGQLAKTNAGQATIDALQFKIRHLFIGTTTFAVLITVLKTVWSSLDYSPGPGLVGIALTGGCISVMVLLNIWAMLGNEINAYKCIVLVASTVLCAIGASLLLTQRFFWVCLITQGIVLILILLLRGQGYRFVSQVNSR